MEENELKTGYEWCLEGNMRILDLMKWSGGEEHYMLEEISKYEFLKRLEGCTIKANSQPRKPEKYLELRMYTLVPYNLLGIQKGIQHEHTVVQHFLNNVHKSAEESRRVERWAAEWKTSIVLNGGTSNEGHYVRHGFKEVWYVGSMQQHLQKLVANGINVSTFYEPDLNSMLTGISFIVDERVFNRKLYPDYVDIPFDEEKDGKNEETMRRWEDNNEMHRGLWVEKIGGEKNAFLREFLRPLKLA